MLRRVVGYLEYGSALTNLEELASLATSEDLEAIDAIIDERAEFTIFSRLADQMELASEQGFTAVGVANQHSNGLTERRNLAWVLALARVEFGAIVAGFSDHPEPYAFVRPESHGYKESLQLLLEGVIGHYEAMPSKDEFFNAERVADEEINTAKKANQRMSFSAKRSRGAKIVGNQLLQNHLIGVRIKTALALGRRVRMARSMLFSLMKPGPETYPRSMATGIDNYRRDLDQAQTYLNGRIRQYLETQVQSTTMTQRSDFVDACGLMLRAEQHEIAAGTAEVTNYQSLGQR